MSVRFSKDWAGIAILVFCATTASAAEFDVTTDIIVQSGQPAPDGNGVFSDTIVFPVLNDAGEVLVWANLLATADAGPLDDWGFFVADRVETVKIFRGGELSAQGNPLRLDPQSLAPNTPSLSRPYALDGFGRIVLAASDTSAALAVYRGDGGGREVLVQEGDSTPIGTLTSIAATIPLSLQANDAGQAAFTGFLTVPGQPSQFGLMRADTGVIDPLLFSGQALPDGRAVANLAFQTAAFTNAGRAAALLNTVGTGFDMGIYSGDGASLTKLLHAGEPAADGLGTLIAGTLFTPQQNSSGQMISMIGVDDFSQDYIGFFTGDGSDLSEVTRTGAAAPDGPIFNFTGDFRINDNGTIVFGAIVTTAIGNVNQLLMRRGDVNLVIASAFSVLPAPIGLELRDPFAFALNWRDQVMFSAFVIAEGVSREALFLFDPDFGLALVARTGQPFAGDVLADLEVALPRFPNTARYSNNAHTAFNNLGEQAFYFQLQNGQAGVALASVEFVPDDSDVLFRDGFESAP